MWTREFESSVMKTLILINENSNRRCYLAYAENKKYFVKEYILDGKDPLLAMNAIERSEKVNSFFKACGINTVEAIWNDNACTHLVSNCLYVAYPWLEAHSVTSIDEALCYDVGKLLAELSNVSESYEGEVHLIVPEKTKFPWEIDSVGTGFFPSTDCCNALERDYYLGEKGYMDLSAGPVTLSHGDIHAGNILTSENSTLVLIDWEKAGGYNLEHIVFDTALNMCGFCKNQTDMKLFERVISGYRENAVGKLFCNVSISAVLNATLFDIISAMNDSFRIYSVSKSKPYYDQGIRFMRQYADLNDRKEHFVTIMSSCLN